MAISFLKKEIFFNILQAILNRKNSAFSAFSAFSASLRFYFLFSILSGRVQNILTQLQDQKNPDAEDTPPKPERKPVAALAEKEEKEEVENPPLPQSKPIQFDATGRMIRPEADPRGFDEKEFLDKTENTFREFVKVGRRKGSNTAADFLEHYLDGSGAPKKVTRDEARKFQFIQNAEKTNQNRFEQGSLVDLDKDFAKGLLTLSDGQTKDVKDHWDFNTTRFKPDSLRNIVFTDGIDELISFGRTKVKSKGDFTATRKGNIITLDGKVTHNWDDTYDFDPMGFIGGAGGAALAKSGRAKPFKFGAAWTQRVKGTVEIKAGRLLNPKLEWFDMNAGKKEIKGKKE